MINMSGLTKKTVYADKVLATLLSVREGAHVSYAELSKGLHRYIKENGLKSLESAQQPGPLTPVGRLRETADVSVSNARTKWCRDCSSEIPSEAVYCDLCGVRQ